MGNVSVCVIAIANTYPIRVKLGSTALRVLREFHGFQHNKQENRFDLFNQNGFLVGFAQVVGCGGGI